MPSTEPACSTSWVDVAESPHPAPHDIEQARRDRGRGERAGEVHLVVDDELAGLHEVADELHGVERVAGGLDAQLLQDLAGGAARCVGDRHDQIGELGVVEARERDAPGVAPVEIGERGEELGRLLLGVAKGGHEEHRHVDQRAGEVAEQEQRGGLGPVQVVEDEDQRADRGEPAEEVGHRFEQLVPLGGVVARGRWRCPDAIEQVRGDPGQLAAEALAVRAQHVLRRVVDERTRRRRGTAASGTAAPSSQRPYRHGGCLRGHCGSARARPAASSCRCPPRRSAGRRRSEPARRLHELGLEPRQLAAPSDEVGSLRASTPGSGTSNVGRRIGCRAELAGPGRIRSSIVGPSGGNPSFDRADERRRLGAGLLGQHGAVLLIGPERVGLATVARQGLDLQTARAVAERMRWPRGLRATRPPRRPARAPMSSSARSSTATHRSSSSRAASASAHGSWRNSSSASPSQSASASSTATRRSGKLRLLEQAGR